MKIIQDKNVYQASLERIETCLNEFENVVLSFSGGKDSSTMFHLTAEVAKKLNRKFAVLIIDLEAQYTKTEEHIIEMLEMYQDIIEPYWVCLPLKLRNAASNFNPVWTCWDAEKKDFWVRQYPENCIKENNFFDFFEPNMEFEEFMVLFPVWYSRGKSTCSLVGIRADESLNRYRTIASRKKEKYQDFQWTTKLTENIYNAYPMYDWKTKDIWVYSNKFKKPHNKIYDFMHKAGVKPSQQRLCQPYGDDQRRGLWLYHLLEPQTWYKVVARVNGVNSMSLYVEENGNVTGYNKIYKPPGHTYESFAQLLLSTMPKKLREHYLEKFRTFIIGWRKRGYDKSIPDEAPMVLENKQWAPSYRRLCKVLLRNDYWCKGLGLTQPKSEAYGKYLKIKKERQKV